MGGASQAVASAPEAPECHCWRRCVSVRQPCGLASSDCQAPPPAPPWVHPAPESPPRATGNRRNERLTPHAARSARLMLLRRAWTASRPPLASLSPLRRTSRLPRPPPCSPSSPSLSARWTSAAYSASASRPHERVSLAPAAVCSSRPASGFLSRRWTGPGRSLRRRAGHRPSTTCVVLCEPDTARTRAVAQYLQVEPV